MKKYRRKNEIECLRFFVPEVLRKIPITESDVSRYFEWSEEGKHKLDIRLSGNLDGFNTLVWAKKWRGITIHELWEDGILNCSGLGYSDFIPGLPDSVVYFVAREIFGGIDFEIIINIWREDIAVLKSSC